MNNITNVLFIWNAENNLKNHFRKKFKANKNINLIFLKNLSEKHLLYVIERSWWTESKIYSVKNLLAVSKNNVQTCSRSCNWNSTKIDKILFLLFLDIKLHMYDITVIYIQKKMNLFWGLQVGLCSTPIAYKAGHAYITVCLLRRYFNFNVERAMLQRTKCKLVSSFM